MMSLLELLTDVKDYLKQHINEAGVYRLLERVDAEIGSLSLKALHITS